MQERPKRALISVSDKTGISEFASALAKLGFELVSSGGTHRHLSQAGLHVIKVSDVTGFPEILGGRVKTLHPNIHGALLARYEMEEHLRELDRHEIAPISLVVVNLYPFAQTIAKEGVTVADAVEQIDIGGPTMVRASAKNFKHLTILTDPRDYARCLAELGEAGTTSLAFRLDMARKAFQHTFAYDRRIADFLDGVVAEREDLKVEKGSDLPSTLRLNVTQDMSLRYGENPHQQAGYYVEEGSAFGERVVQHQGKELSYNNLVDMDAAWACVCDFTQPTAVVVKHTNPCGVASHENLESAFRRARQVDEVSSFGGIVALNREVDEATARAINEKFAELVVAPAFSEDALKRFRRKKNLRVLEMKYRPSDTPWDMKPLAGGLLVQDRDNKRVPVSKWQQVSKRAATAEELKALETAWTIVVHVKSNAIVYADAEGAVGIGAGQMSRVDSAKIAIWKAGEAGLSVVGSAMASDAFFPFRDSIDAAAEAGVKAIVEPGGSVRDDEVIAAADEHGIALYFTDTRHFKH